MSKQTTVATLRTPPGRGGIAVITLNGPASDNILARVFRPLRSHRDAGGGALQLGHLIIGAEGEQENLDQAVVCNTPAGAEINIHGGPHVARRTLELLVNLGARPQGSSEPSDATLPAAHPRWDNPAIGQEILTVLPQARSALVAAALSRQWSAGLSELAAGGIVPNGEELRAAAAGLAKMHRLLHPAEVVLAGAPNSGKSTLANTLIGREVSIVHHRAGTTRDWVRELAVFGGIPVWLTDTAGLWEVPNDVDAEAVRRASRRAEAADLVVLLGAGGRPERPDWLGTERILTVASKCDVVTPPPTAQANLTVSSHTGAGLDRLRQAIVHAIGLENFRPNEPMAFTRRQADLLTRAAVLADSTDCKGALAVLHELLRGTEPLSARGPDRPTPH